MQTDMIVDCCFSDQCFLLIHFRNSVESFYVVVDLAGALVKYIHNQSLDEEPLILQKLATYLTFHDFPFPNHLAEAMKGMIYVTHYLAITIPLL